MVNIHGIHNKYMAFDVTTKSVDLDQLESEFWVEQAALGNTQAFGNVYQHYLPLVYKFVYFRLNSKEDAEDLTEKIFFKVWQAIAKYDPEKASFKTWLFTITRRTIIDFYRTHKVTYELKEAFAVGVEDSTLEEIDNRLAMDKIIPILKSLPEEQAEVLALRFLSELSAKEAAAIMDKSEGAIRVLQHRALKQVRQDLQLI